jgi:S-layer protein (TIGR01567 family)
MAIKRYLQGIAIVVLILGLLSNVVGILNTPSGNQGTTTNNSDESRNFSITIDKNATVNWFINGLLEKGPELNKTSSFYLNTSAKVGNWNVSVVAFNESNPSESDMTTWLWIVSTPLPTESAPGFTAGPTAIPLDTSALINFTINQSNANTIVRYGNDSSSLSLESPWQNGTGNNVHTIQLPGLSPGKQYYYSVYAYNASNQSLFSNSTSTNSFTTVNPTAPNITSVTNDIATATSINFTIGVNQSDALIGVNYGETTSLELGFKWNNNSGSPRIIQLTSLTPGKTYNYSVYAFNKTNQIYSNYTTISNFTTKYPAPIINSIDPTTNTLEMTVGESKILTVVIGSRSGNLSWFENNNTTPLTSKLVNASESMNYTFSRNTKGTYKITANLSDANGSDSREWIINVHPATFRTGNRIWDGSKRNDFALTYSWTPMSFSGFYYNAKDDVGNENITITLKDYTTRTIYENNLVYTTIPQEVSFTYSNFGKYNVIGFMAEKYFAGYTGNTTASNPRPSTTFSGISAVGQGQLHKVLIDDDTKRTISVGGTIALQEGYVLKATDIDLNARTMLLSLLKDGSEVDVSPLSANETYVYKKKVGGVEDLPLIMVRFDSVFSGQELQVAFMKGLFQISDNPTIIKTGNKFRNMEIITVDNNGIRMENSNDIGLTKGTTADVMGDVKILVANNDSVLRFALSTEKTGNFEVRSTVYKADDTNRISEWTPYNFGMNIGKTSIGFYYDLDDGIGSERLNLTSISGSSINDQGLTYSTSPDEVKFTYTKFGRYQVIGFMADKYFAGYTSNTGISDSSKIITRPTTDFDGKSALANGALHKVLIDDDTKRTISVGGTIALKEGYVLKATDIDLNARTMLLSLLKDGSEVDMTPLAAGETYVYSKTVGGTESLPLIMIRFENVFSGQELQVAFLNGIFQISDTPTMIKVADQFGKMEIRSFTKDLITMSNDGSIGLDKNKNDVLMGNLRLKVADNDKLRFYFAVDVTAEMIQNQLVIDAPAKAMAGDTIKIKITAGGVGIDNATINIGTDSGTTDKNGILNYTLPRGLKGTYSITASMTGYEKATQNIEIEKYIDYSLSIEAPSQANQFETITIKVLYNGTAMSGAKVIFDNTTVGTSDSNGEVTYKLETSGTHSISASKTSYITVARDIEIRAPYSEFKGLDINITPNPGFAGEAFLVRSNITNVGTKSDLLQVDLIVNGTSVDNKTITLGAGEKLEVNFTRIEAKAGNVTVEIMGQSMLYEAKEKPTNYLLIGAIVTGIGIVIIYVLTSKGLIDLELLKHKFSMLFKK